MNNLISNENLIFSHKSHIRVYCNDLIKYSKRNRHCAYYTENIYQDFFTHHDHYIACGSAPELVLFAAFDTREWDENRH